MVIILIPVEEDSPPVCFIATGPDTDIITSWKGNSSFGISLYAFKKSNIAVIGAAKSQVQPVYKRLGRYKVGSGIRIQQLVPYFLFSIHF